MSTSYGWEGIRQVCATLLGARHVPERLWGSSVYTWGAIQVFDLYLPNRSFNYQDVTIINVNEHMHMCLSSCDIQGGKTRRSQDDHHDLCQLVQWCVAAARLAVFHYELCTAGCSVPALHVGGHHLQPRTNTQTYSQTDLTKQQQGQTHRQIISRACMKTKE